MTGAVVIVWFELALTAVGIMQRSQALVAVSRPDVLRRSRFVNESSFPRVPNVGSRRLGRERFDWCSFAHCAQAFSGRCHARGMVLVKRAVARSHARRRPCVIALCIVAACAVGCATGGPQTQAMKGEGGSFEAGGGGAGGQASLPVAGKSSSLGGMGGLDVSLGGADAQGGNSAPGRAGGAGGGATGDGGGSAGAAGGNPLVHPGALLTQTELARIRAAVAVGASSAAWDAIRNTDAGTNYQPSVSPTITDVYALQNQGHAAYVLAMKWAASGDPAFATAAKRVLDAWVDTVTVLDSSQTTLRVGIGTVQMANAAELIAYGFDGAAGWQPTRVSRAKAWFANVVWPHICAGNAQRSSNWGTSALSGCMSSAIFIGERAMFDYAVSAYKNGFTDGPDGCAGVTQYVCDASGQATEAGRDQTHPQGGVGHLVEVALMASHQGTDLVTFGDNRVVAGMEYLAKYNLGNDVPYDPNFPDPCNVHPSWMSISTTGRGSFSPVYEMADRLFTAAGITHPYTTLVLQSAGYRPEKTNSDHAGMGTLLPPAP
jgi:Alginate lyase